MSAGFGAEVDLRDVENGLRRMQLAGMHLKPVFRAARKALRADQREHAREQRGPEAAWRPLSAKTIEHRKQRTGKQGRKRRRPIRARSVRILGKLPGAFSITYDDRSIKGTSRVKWSGAHNSPNGATVGHRSNLPGRQFLYASANLLRTISRAAVDYMATEWKRK